MSSSPSLETASKCVDHNRYVKATAQKGECPSLHKGDSNEGSGSGIERIANGTRSLRKQGSNSNEAITMQEIGHLCSFDINGGDVHSGDVVPQLEKVGVQLEGRTLWQQFDHLGTEMIVTKAGR